MRVLILSANTGGGHNSTAVALGEQLKKCGAEFEVADTLAFISERVSEFISWGHSYVYRKMPRLFGVGYRYEEKHPVHFIYEQCARGAEALQERLTAGNYDAVLCVHVFSGLMMTEVRRRYRNPIPAYFIATDYTCSPGVSEMKLDAYFIPHRMLLGEFVRKGDISADQLIPSGIPVRSTFYDVLDKAEARRLLGLPDRGRIVLLSCGSMGCGKLERSAMMLFRRLPEDATLVVLCGRNQKTYDALLPYASDRLRVLQFTDRVDAYMSAADLYLTKPGGLTTTEAIVKRIPMVFINAVPGLETRNFQFLTSCGLAEGAKSWRQVVSIVQRNLSDPRLYEVQISAMQDFCTQNAAELICKRILKQS